MKMTTCHDGGNLTADQVKEFGLAWTDLLHTDFSGSRSTSQFVGIVISEDKNVLLSVPKFFRERKGLKDAQLLLRVFESYKAHDTPNFTGNLDVIKTNIPLEDFETILNYYLQNGLYRKPKRTITSKGTGKINWKRTLQSEIPIFSNGNLIFKDLCRSQTQLMNNVVTLAMQYVLMNNQDLLRLLQVELKFSDCVGAPSTSVELERELSLRLHQELQETYVDKDRHLIHALVGFLNHHSAVGPKYIVTTTFDIIWEKIVLDYLNHNYAGLDKCRVVFSPHAPTYNFEYQKVFVIDFSQNGKPKWQIRPDYYMRFNDQQLIFDAKYYVNLDNLNYKQLVYGLLLGEGKRAVGLNTVNMLFAPTDGKTRSGEHISLLPEFAPTDRQVRIDIRWLNMNEMLNQFVSVTRWQN
ncbi:LlaJI family restriction endonuclease [Lacticaseibacillus paracasei]|uniref:LlaJI family restriction endonuclease n=1 Tax=Lacticaseibacillus paracasei TaxID=1597 RepID=UPI001C0333DF|nr:LlaJI family restriction endonuclease [Lacticaseibacillus paracasei]MBT9263029.1 LlaJI family restriction endonuclease [Lacticaseibacillus paracasei]